MIIKDLITVWQHTTNPISKEVMRETMDEFNEKVKEKLGEGYKTFGDVRMVAAYNYFVIARDMIIYESAGLY